MDELLSEKTIIKNAEERYQEGGETGDWRRVKLGRIMEKVEFDTGNPVEDDFVEVPVVVLHVVRINLELDLPAINQVPIFPLCV